jgi:predicted nucleic acid-binding Zn ribbon protein
MPKRTSNRRTEDAPRGPQRAADIVAQLMARRGYGRLQAAAITHDAWAAAAGEKFAGHSRAGAVKRGTLEVLVRNSAVLQELTFEKKKVLKKLVALLPDEKISDLKFRVGSVE